MLQNLRNPRILVAFLHDAAWIVLALYFSMTIRWGRFDPFSFPIHQQSLLYALTFIAQILCLSVAGLYQGMWRFSSTKDLTRIIKGVSAGVLFALVLNFQFSRLESIPRSLFIIDWLVLIMGLGMGRFLYRMWKDSHHTQSNTAIGNKSKVLIIGAGSAGERLLRDIQLNPQLGLQVVGFIDDNPAKLNRTIHGVRVLGHSSTISKWVESLGVKRLFIAIPSATGDDLDHILKSTEHLDLEIKALPKVDDIITGKIEVSLLRNLSLDDLLGRKPVELDGEHISQMIRGKTVMVTGSGGSIGSELCKQISRFAPQTVVLFEACEFFLYNIEMDLQRAFPSIHFVTVIGDVRDANRVRSIMETQRPDIVFHAAAYKHVPMMEKNPSEAILTNVQGTKIVAETAELMGVKKFVLISTDKAVNPTNVMGTTKRIAEMIVENAHSKGSRTQFIIVRFGNVIGSNGSVIPLFKKQIESGGPVTITHPEITRYFMSISEASKLVLQAASMGLGGEVFVLDMGKPVKIVDLVDQLLHLAGLKKDKDIKVEFVGLRPGEKLYEELFQESEEFARTSHVQVFRAKNRPVEPLFEKKLDELILSTRAQRSDANAEALIELVPEYMRYN